MSEQTPYSDQHQDALAQRALHDAELIQGGARFNAMGGLAITGAQHDQLSAEMQHSLGKETAADQLEAFKATHEYGQIAVHTSALSDISRGIGMTHLGQAGRLRAHEMAAARAGRDPQFLDEERATGYLYGEGIPIDLVGAKSGPNPEETFRGAKRAIDSHVRYLETDIVPKLAARPDIRINHQVAVRRSPQIGEQVGRIDGGWTIARIAGDGRLVVEKPREHGRPLQKRVTVDETLALNPPTQDRRAS